ncbi:ABC transporter ATP-binding protein [Demequina globuliformis]|uniref:ABC transporter ATP-binding protein n=1 Tax=Demequina globuliformis TaxID=676202 RepID=UPI0007838CEA|nr:ABC transporter ATP-binding protein [Demequina globuliformis]
MTTLLSARDLTKVFGDVTALDSVTLDIDAGECVGLLGPNGAGKTTLLSLAQGLRRPTTGSVQIFGGDPLDAANRQRLGSTPQTTGLPEALRVGEVLEFVAAHYDEPSPRDQIIDEFGLEPLLRKQCGALSGGQQRRVAVALAFIGNPELVLLDEPTTGLDVDARRALWDAVRARHAAGCAVVVTSHHLEEIEQLAQRVVVIDQGAVRADGTLSSIVASVARRRVTLSGVPAQRIAELDPTAAVTEDGGTVEAVVADADSLVRSLVQAGEPFSQLTVRGATLEEAFLALTKEAV